MGTQRNESPKLIQRSSQTFHGMDDAKEILAAMQDTQQQLLLRGLAEMIIQFFLATNADDGGFDTRKNKVSTEDRQKPRVASLSVSKEVAGIEAGRGQDQASRTEKRKSFDDILIDSLGYGIQSNAEVLGYEEEISRGIFAFRETDAGYYDIPLYSRFKQVEYKGVPHPLSGDYTPREQEDIDDSTYDDGELGAVSDHSVNDDPIHDHIPIPSIEQVTIATQKTQPQVPKPQQQIDPIYRIGIKEGKGLRTLIEAARTMQADFTLFYLPIFGQKQFNTAAKLQAWNVSELVKMKAGMRSYAGRTDFILSFNKYGLDDLLPNGAE
ncbi:hypothetical protein Tco_0547446 [Tanacetum coccineum]